MLRRCGLPRAFSKQAQLSYIILTALESALGPDAIAGADTLQPLLAALPESPEPQQNDRPDALRKTGG